MSLVNVNVYIYNNLYRNMYVYLSKYESVYSIISFNFIIHMNFIILFILYHIIHMKNVLITFISVNVNTFWNAWYCIYTLYSIVISVY